jgi:uncharacterized protein (DUF934 family)
MSARILLADGSFNTAESIALLPLADYLALDTAARSNTGVQLEPADEPSAVLTQAPLIAVHFPNFKDGRGYSIATLLRSRYAFKGDLRAVGDVLIDQLFLMRRVGFSSFALRADQNAERSAAALQDFSEVYSRAVDQPLPLFRRRLVGGARI